MSLPNLRLSRWARLKQRTVFVLFLAGMAGVGLLAQFQWVGTLLIVLYSMYALLRRLPARVTFIAALGLLGVVPVAIVLTNWTVAQNFAAYSFLLLIFGVVTTTLELKRGPREAT